MATKRVGQKLVDEETGEILAAEVTVAPIFWKTPYNHDTNAESDRVALRCNDDSLTKQEFKEESDINTIIDRFTRTGEPPPVALPEHFADTSKKTTYFEMSSAVAEANAIFYQLPARIRAQFQNDPDLWADNVMKHLATGNDEVLRDIGIDVTLKPAQPPTPTGGTPAPVPENGPPSGPKNAPSGA